MVTGKIILQGENKKAHPKAANIFATLCQNTTMKVHINHEGVDFTGTEEQVEAGRKIASNYGLESVVVEATQ